MVEPLNPTPAPELIPDEVLASMERDGWTPTQVRDLIKRYRELAREVVELRDQMRRAENAMDRLAEMEERDV